LRHILDAIARIEEYVAGKSFVEFEHNYLLQDGVIRQLTIIGEAARCLSATLQESRSTIPWADVIGMRNILIHDYIEVDVKEVWKTVRKDLPVFREQVVGILCPTGKGEG